jgi:uncharacterized membrane protein YdfJ with MMPL/SSD domain
LALGRIIVGMKRLLVIAIVAAAALILGLPAAHLVSSSEARPVPAIELRAPETTAQQQTKNAEGDKKRQGSVARTPTSAPGEASPAPALPPAPAGGDDDDDADDDDGDDDGGSDD